MSERTVQPISESNIDKQKRESVAQPRERMGSVIIHNDDVTPYEYVVHTLNAVFMLSEELADHIAFTAHQKGSAVVVVCTRSEAEKLVSVANGRAKVEGYPLTFTLETE